MLKPLTSFVSHLRRYKILLSTRMDSLSSTQAHNDIIHFTSSWNSQNFLIAPGIYASTLQTALRMKSTSPNRLAIRKLKVSKQHARQHIFVLLYLMGSFGLYACTEIPSHFILMPLEIIKIKEAIKKIPRVHQPEHGKSHREYSSSNGYLFCLWIKCICLWR